MIIVPVKDGENIERALKKFKRKFEKTGAVREMRARKEFKKPSVLKGVQEALSPEASRKGEGHLCAASPSRGRSVRSTPFYAR